MTARMDFDNEKYLQEQTAAILERVNQFNNKLYLEIITLNYQWPPDHAI